MVRSSVMHKCCNIVETSTQIEWNTIPPVSTICSPKHNTNTWQQVTIQLKYAKSITISFTWIKHDTIIKVQPYLTIK